MRCAEVLFEREGVPWDHSPSRDKRQALARQSADGAGKTDSNAGKRIANEVNAVMCRADSQANAPTGVELAPTLLAHARHDQPFVWTGEEVR